MELIPHPTTGTGKSTLPVLKIFVGEEVLTVLDDADFLIKWNKLYLNCSWGTVFQSKEFVAPWYRLYSSDYLPVVIAAELNDELVGLITLTKHKQEKHIMAAGLGGAEYQTWLATPAWGEPFIQMAFNKLLTLYPRHSIALYNTPPGTPLQWAMTHKKWQHRCILKKFDRPLMNLRSADVSKVFRKKQFREKANRLKRIGNLTFERITDTTQFASLLDEMAALSDFRKGARYNFLQFINDPRGKQFLLEIFKQGILHTTVLRLEGQLIASIAAPSGKGWVHLAGLNTHSPVYGRHSPGLINFVMLGQLLLEEGIVIFDLTPGGDGYKERLATSRDFVHELYVAGTVETQVKKAILQPTVSALKSCLRRGGYSPSQIKFDASKIKGRLIQSFRLGQPSYMFSWHYLRTGSPLHFSICKVSMPAGSNGPSVKVNDIIALLSYQSEVGSQTRWDFLADAMHRLELGERAYTLSENGRLLYCIWYGKKAIAAPGSNYPFPKDAHLVELVYCCSQSTMTCLEDFIRSVESAIHQGECMQQEVYCLVDKRNFNLWKQLGSIGFIEANRFTVEVK